MPFIALAIVAVVAIGAIAERGGQLRLGPDGLKLDMDDPGDSPGFE